MKKTGIILGVILAVGLGIGFMYLLYKTWDIFGFWTLMWTGALSMFSAFFLGNLTSSKTEKGGLIIYNPKEWPKFFNMLVSLTIGYYLYTVISTPDISNYDYTFGMAYLLFLTVLPTSYAIFKLIRDRNDFISISPEILKYKDNGENGEFNFSDIEKVELESGIKLTFKDERTLTIKTGNMNFNTKDTLCAYNDIKSKLPEEKEIKEISN